MSSITAALEQYMESPRAARPHPAQWRTTGEGDINFNDYYTTAEVAERLWSSPRKVRAFSSRIPNIITLSGKRFFRKELIDAIRSELLQGNSIDVALVNVGVESAEESV